MNIDVLAAIQAERIIRIETPLGLDVLLPERLEMREGINSLFELKIAVRSKRGDLKADELVGKLVDVSLETGLGIRRSWNGLVVAFTEGPPVTRGLRAYHLTIVPQHWLMTQRSDCRIWLDKSSVEVAEILCAEHGLFAPVTTGIVRPPKPQHYSVQWNETDLAYLTRRLEEDGIWFWFAHEGGAPGSVSAKHTLHIASDPFGYTQGAEPDVRFAMGSTDRNHISKFEKTFRFVPGKRSSADWNFLTPRSVPAGETPSLVSLPGNAAYDLYEYPAIGGYGSEGASQGITSDQVEAQSRLRMQAAEVEHEKIEGASNLRSLTPGARFKPYDVANPLNLFEEQVIHEIVHMARDRSYENNEGELEYSNRFVSIPARVPATPHRTTPRPRIDGTQIAIVAGPSGEEIHTEAHGRVKVWFPWDRRAKKDGSDTCWIRVAQSWGGAGWGGQVIPRIEMEAIISYLDGDPDKPVIMGLVPNPKQKVPYKLPENKTKSVFRTNTHKSKNIWNFNEISFEDKEKSEELFIHAQKDMNVEVENSKHEYVGSLSGTTTMGYKIDQVGVGRMANIGYSDVEKIGGSKVISVGLNGFFDFNHPVFNRHMNMYDMLQNESMMSAPGNYILNCTAGVSVTALDSISMYANSGAFIQSDATVNISGGGNVVIASGQQTFVEAEDTLMIRCGKSCIALDKEGRIVISGASIKIQGDVDGSVEKEVKIKSDRIDLN